MLGTVCCLDGLPSSDPMLCSDSCVRYKPLVNSSLDVLRGCQGSPKSRSGPCVTYPPRRSSCPSTWESLFVTAVTLGTPRSDPRLAMAWLPLVQPHGQNTPEEGS